MAKKALIYLIYDDLVSAVKGIASKTSLGRPEPIGSDVASLIVIDIPTEIRSRIKGSYDMSVDCYATFDIFCKSKSDRTLNIGSQSNLTQKVLDVFPINGKAVIASNPTVLLKGFDDTGYQVTSISFKLRTKLNARENQ
jgi:hypothetical protein